MVKKRIFYFDILEFIAIYMVVFCHYTTLGNTFFDNAFMTLCFVAVPVFYMVNGALTLGSETFTLKKHYARTFHRYIVGCVWRLIYFLFAIYRDTVSLATISKTSLFSYLIFWTDISGCNVGHMWFMRTLIAISLITPVFYYCNFRLKEKASALLSIVLVLFVPFLLEDMELVIQELQHANMLNGEFSVLRLKSFSPYGYGSEMLFFFLIGAFVFFNKEEILKINSSRLRKAISLVFIVAWGAMLFTRKLTAGTWYWDAQLLHNGYNRLSTLVAAIALFILLMLLEERLNISTKMRELIILISKNTSGIYYCHWIIGAVLIPYMSHCNLFANALRALLVLLISLVVSVVLSKIPIIKKLVM